MLAECCQALLNAGQPRFPAGHAKLFVHPEHSALVIEYLRLSGALFSDGTRLFFDDLKPRHVIFSSDFALAVEDAIVNRRGNGQNGGTGRDNVRAKRTARFVLGELNAAARLPKPEASLVAQQAPLPRVIGLRPPPDSPSPLLAPWGLWNWPQVVPAGVIEQLRAKIDAGASGSGAASASKYLPIPGTSFGLLDPGVPAG